MRTIFVSFYGPSGSGKSTCYKYAARFLREREYKVCRADVAYSLRIIQNYAYKLFGRDIQCPRSDNFRQDGALLGFLAKHFENNLGVCAVDRIKKTLASCETRKLVFINTDCRNNSYKKLKSLGFIFIRLNVYQSVLIKRRAQRGDITAFNYESDVEKYDAIKSDYVIGNNGSLDDLRDSICSVFKKILNPAIEK